MFENFHSFAWGYRTFRAEYAFIESLHPPSAQITSKSVYAVSERNLIDCLKEAGYETWFFHGYFGEFWARRLNYDIWGIDRFFSAEELVAAGASPGFSFGRGPKGPGIDDDEMSRVLPKQLEGASKPFFAFYATLSSHFPYGDLPAEHRRGTFSGPDADYRTMMAYVDRSLGELLESLEARGLGAPGVRRTRFRSLLFGRRDWAVTLVLISILGVAVVFALLV